VIDSVQPIHTIGNVLFHILPGKLKENGEVWIVHGTGLGSAVGGCDIGNSSGKYLRSQQQLQLLLRESSISPSSSVLEGPLTSWLGGNGYDYLFGQD